MLYYIELLYTNDVCIYTLQSRMYNSDVHNYYTLYNIYIICIIIPLSFLSDAYYQDNNGKHN